MINDGVVEPNLYLDIFKPKDKNASGKKRQRDNTDLAIETFKQGVFDWESKQTESHDQKSVGYQIVNMTIKLDKKDEDELIRQLEEDAMEKFLDDPIRELDEALMDRSTAQQTLQKVALDNKKKFK